MEFSDKKVSTQNLTPSYLKFLNLDHTFDITIKGNGIFRQKSEYPESHSYYLKFLNVDHTWHHI